ncbi:uncharacterized protein LOC134288058 [Aedes albopictus]|uniref:Integrase zinc-binding domain-containing protein n=1 Tax=Aedes albopictus TaxID=7160 RepID=A0ABM1ZX85_AEDAL
MQEYLDLGHMEKAGTFSLVEQPNEECYFIPHHAIQRPDSSTTKVRVVFDASAKSSNGISLNDLLLVGPTLQPHLVNILLAFRVHKVVATTDVSKMFRQISIREEDRRFLLILWRSSCEEEISIYRLTTVTYGTACAPFQATRTLMQVCEDEAENFPLAAQFGKKSVYVDDALFGAETVEELLEKRKQFEAMLAKAGFELHKWCSNREEVLADLPTEKLEQKVLFSEEGRTKTLGLTWQPAQDIFSFEIPSAAFSEGVPTKRKVLSDISKLFDPLGFAGPVVMTGKLLMQELWRQKQTWDGALNAKQEKLWYEFRRQLQQMESIKISRCVLPLSNTISVDLLGFSDASEKGYEACLYLKSRNIQGQIAIRLLCSKSHVAPLKANRATIPRLELCGAVLLAQLVDQVTRSLPIDIDQIKLWSDSTIALSWINTCPSKLDVFVANRVAKILRFTRASNWCHVGGHENPADLVSRGLMPSELESATLWWRGPSFLKDPETTWSTNVNLIAEEDLPELTTITANPVVTERFPLFDNCSSYNTMIRVVARIKRLFQNRKRGPDHQLRGVFTMQELRLAKLILVRLVQKGAYPEVFDQLQNQVTTKNNSLIPLSPFVDNHGILRVGGRLSKSSCSYDQKHQMILPPSHPFTDAVIRSVHTSNMHVGVQTTLTAIRREYWIVRGKSAVKRVIRAYVRCFKYNARPIRQYMGDLPACRLEGEYPFYRVGIDLCGPIAIKQRNKRSTVEHKGWIALFVCLETKAIHLEIVSELSTAAFLAAFDRFVSRRGKPASV